MEQKIFNSNKSRIKLNIDEFKRRYWMFRSAASIHKYAANFVNYFGQIIRPGFITIYDVEEFDDMLITPVCMI